eukprot:gene5609-4089_t
MMREGFGYRPRMVLCRNDHPDSDLRGRQFKLWNEMDEGTWCGFLVDAVRRTGAGTDQVPLKYLSTAMGTDALVRDHQDRLYNIPAPQATCAVVIGPDFKDGVVDGQTWLSKYVHFILPRLKKQQPPNTSLGIMGPPAYDAMQFKGSEHEWRGMKPKQLFDAYGVKRTIGAGPNDMGDNVFCPCPYCDMDGNVPDMNPVGTGEPHSSQKGGIIPVKQSGRFDRENATDQLKATAGEGAAQLANVIDMYGYGYNKTSSQPNQSASKPHSFCSLTNVLHGIWSSCVDSLDSDVDSLDTASGAVVVHSVLHGI